MFAYLIIGSEIAILYTVFWYVFLREPKPFKLHGNMWGQYEINNGFSARHFDPTLPLQEQNPEVFALEQQFYADETSGNKSRVHFRHATPARYADLPKIKRNPALGYGWVFEEEPPSAWSRLLVGFRETLQLCFRVT
jgi:hypothetical protein